MIFNRNQYFWAWQSSTVTHTHVPLHINKTMWLLLRWWNHRKNGEICLYTESVREFEVSARGKSVKNEVCALFYANYVFI